MTSHMTLKQESVQWLGRLGFACFLLLAFALPGLVQCEYPWPDKVTQHKGYIEVFNSNACTPAICCSCRFMFAACWKLVRSYDIHCNYEVCSD